MRSAAADMKAAVWEKAEAVHEGTDIKERLIAKEFVHQNGRLTGMLFQPVRSVVRTDRRSLIPSGEPLRYLPCDDVVIAIGQEPTFPWIERDLGIDFSAHQRPSVDPKTLQSTHPKVFFGGDAAFGPQNIVTAVAHAHEAAISIDHALTGRAISDRPTSTMVLTAQPTPAALAHIPHVALNRRLAVPALTASSALKDLTAEVELGFAPEQAAKEAMRCLHCELETVFASRACVECKACETICPTECITFTTNGDESDLRNRLKAPACNLQQSLYVVDGLVSGRVMVKDEDLCLHCGLCAQNCPTGAWQMQTFDLQMAQAWQGRDACTQRGAPRV